jgi:hypothetical protein
MTETVNKSKLMKLRVDSNMIADYGRVIKLKNSPSHHWSAVEDVLVRLPRHWNAISNAFHEIPIKNDKKYYWNFAQLFILCDTFKQWHKKPKS